MTEAEPLRANKRLPVVGRVQKVVRHPNADLLHIATVEAGHADPVVIVFGGDRVLQPGDLVPVALPGVRVPGDRNKKTRVQQVRGIRSYGELLSTDELGWTMRGPDRVHVLPADRYRVGEPVARPPSIDIEMTSI